MNQKQFITKIALWTAIVAAVIIALIGLGWGKVIEGNLFAEIAKWVVMGIVVIGILEGFIFMGVGGVIYHHWYEKRPPKIDQN